MIRSQSSRNRSVQAGLRRQVPFTCAVFGSLAMMLFTGCSSSISKGFHTPPVGETAVAGFKGKTHGGQFPVSGSTVQFYAALASGAGYGAASTPVGDPVTSDASGNWVYPAFTCASPSDEIYVVSSGGNPGLSGTVQNNYIVLTAALGPCSQLSGIPFVTVNEVTTVATEYALAGLSTDYLHVATSSTNPIGLTNAFATVNNLVDITTGQARSVTPAYAMPPANTVSTTFASIVPYDLINTLANVLASCVNTDGATNPACSNLLSITGGASSRPIGQQGVQGPQATNTADAALYIAHNPGLPAFSSPGANVAALFNLTTPAAPFGPALTKVGNDYTMTLNFIGGGLGGLQSDSVAVSNSLTIDHNGSLWMPIEYQFSQGIHGPIDDIASFNNLGAPLSPNITVDPVSQNVISIGGFSGGGLESFSGGISTDLNNNEWLGDTGSCLVEFTPSGVPATGSPFTSACAALSNAYANYGVSGTPIIDTSSNVWAISQAPSYEGVQPALISTDGTGNLRNGFPVLKTGGRLIAADYSGNVVCDTLYIGGLTTSISLASFNPDGTMAQGINSFGLSAVFNSYPVPVIGSVQGASPYWVFLDSTNFIEGIQLSTNSTGPAQIYPGPNAFYQDSGNAAAADGNSNYFVKSGNTFGPYGITALQSNGTQISPSSIGYTGGSALMSLTNPSAIAVDQSGNVWVLNDEVYRNPVSFFSATVIDTPTLTEFVGLAAPVNPVAAENAKNGTYGQKP